MGLFDDAGIDSTEDLDSVLNDGPHKAKIVDIIRSQESKNTPGTFYHYWVYETPDHDWPIRKGFRIMEPGRKFSDLDDTDDSFNVYTTKQGVKRQTERTFYRQKYQEIKRWIMQHGVDEENVNNVDNDDFINMEVIIDTFIDKKGYAQISGVTVPGASGATLPTVSSAPTVTQTATESAPASVSVAPAGTNPFARN
jgi:hypothetical protein